MSKRRLAYSNSGSVDPSNFEDNDYFFARLCVARAQEFSDREGLSTYSLNFAQLDQTDVLPNNLSYSFVDRDGSFKEQMGVSVTRKLRGRHVLVVFRRSDKGIEAVIPSQEIL